MVSIVTESIDVNSAVTAVTTTAAGAVDVFIGTTRDNSKGRKVLQLEYEAYTPMATKKMEMIEREAAERWEIQQIAMVHRVGIVPPGEASVVIAVSSAHRDEAFKACRYLIDRLKEVVPIWKREYFADGTVEWSQHTHEQNTAGQIGQ